MKTKITLLSLLVVLTGINSALAQVGIGTTDPKTSLQVTGNPASTTTADGIQGPSLTLAQLDAKIAAYGTDQDGAIVYIDDVTVASTVAETANITATGYYYYDAPNDVWKAMGDASSSSTTTYSIGDFAQGGIVFWVDGTGQHGLIAATGDQSTGIQWTSDQTITNAVRDGIGAGMHNTERIIANQGTGSYAAQLCANYQGGGYGDWYLPSKYELNLLYQQKTAVGGFASAFYWSSTEINFMSAWYQNFWDGSQFNFEKNYSIRVRAVRAF